MHSSFSVIENVSLPSLGMLSFVGQICVPVASSLFVFSTLKMVLETDLKRMYALFPHVFREIISTEYTIQIPFSVQEKHWKFPFNRMIIRKRWKCAFSWDFRSLLFSICSLDFYGWNSRETGVLFSITVMMLAGLLEQFSLAWNIHLQVRDIVTCEINYNNGSQSLLETFNFTNFSK